MFTVSEPAKVKINNIVNIKKIDDKNKNTINENNNITNNIKNKLPIKENK